MRWTIFLTAATLSLSACGVTLSDPAVRDGTREARRAHAGALLGEDVGLMRRTGDALLSALACGWGEPSCPL